MTCISGSELQLTKHTRALSRAFAMGAAAFVSLFLTFVSGTALPDVDGAISAYESADYETAAAEFLKHGKDPRATYYLGLMHLDGHGGRLKNYPTALSWFQKSGASGHIEAQLKAASMFEQGLGVPQSSKKAVDWYRRAAEKGDVRGQLRLGQAYRAGEGVPRDRLRALLWLERAAEQGNAEALNELDGLRRDRQITDAEFAARLAGVPNARLELTARGERVRTELPHILDPIEFLPADSKIPVRASELGDRWIIVERENDVLAVLPRVSVVTDAGDIIEVGTIRIVAVPKDDDTLEYTLSVANALKIRDSSRQVIGSITHDQFQISGVWSETLRTSLETAVVWSGVKAVIQESGVELVARSISGSYRLEQTEPGVWQQASTIELTDFRAAPPGAEGGIKLGRAAFNSIVDGAHPDVYKRFMGQYTPGYEARGVDTQAARQKPSTGVAVTEDEVAAVIGRAFEISFEFADVSVEAPELLEPMELASANFLLGMKDLDQRLGGLDLSFGYEGFGRMTPRDVQGKSDDQESGGQKASGESMAGDTRGATSGTEASGVVVPPAVPRQVALEIAVERVPARAIATSALATLLRQLARTVEGGQGTDDLTQFDFS